MYFVQFKYKIPLKLFTTTTIFAETQNFQLPVAPVRPCGPVDPVPPVCPDGPVLPVAPL